MATTSRADRHPSARAGLRSDAGFRRRASHHATNPGGADGRRQRHADPPRPGAAAQESRVFAVARPFARQPRKKRAKQLCPVPGCKNPAAPVFGMVCSKHKDIPKAKIKEYREARRAQANGRPSASHRPRAERYATSTKRSARLSTRRRRRAAALRAAAPTSAASRASTKRAKKPASASSTASRRGRQAGRVASSCAAISARWRSSSFRMAATETVTPWARSRSS